MRRECLNEPSRFAGTPRFASITVLTVLLAAYAVQPSALAQSRSVQEGTTVTLAELEQMALRNNPALTQADHAIQAAEGRRIQAGLYPNPIIGYQGEEFAFRGFREKSEHFFFFEQPVLLGGKLRKGQRVHENERLAAESEAEALRYRVLNDVRLLYYHALGKQQLLDLRLELSRIANRALDISAELFNIGQADMPDLLEIEIEAQRAELDVISAELERDQVWQVLAAVVANPMLRPTRLAGDLETGIPNLDQEAVLQSLLRDSPEIRSARARVEASRAALERARAQRVPDLFLRGGLGYSFEELSPLGRRTGPEANVEIGVRIPLFDRNQGGIRTAEAELAIAESEVSRLEFVLRAKLATTFATYESSRRLVQRYQSEVTPRAQRAYDMYLAGFRQMAAAYPQVLIAQRTLFQVRADYVNSLVSLWQSAIRMQGFMLTDSLTTPLTQPLYSNGRAGGADN